MDTTKQDEAHPRPLVALFAQQLRTILANRPKKRDELAKGVGVDPGTVSDWTGAASMPKPEQLIKLADFLECTVDFLLGRTESPEQVPPGMFMVDYRAYLALVGEGSRPPQNHFAREPNPGGVALPPIPKVSWAAEVPDSPRLVDAKTYMRMKARVDAMKPKKGKRTK